MEDAETEYYEEVGTEVEPYEDDITIGDTLFIIGFIMAVCIGIAFILNLLKKNIRNVHLKLGDKVEMSLETKDDEPKSK